MEKSGETENLREKCDHPGHNVTENSSNFEESAGVFRRLVAT